MENGKIKIARLWSKYEGYVTSRASIIFGLDPDKFSTICIYLAKESEAPNPYTEKGFEVFYVSDKKSGRGINLIRIMKLARILKDQKIDILHCHRHKATVHGVIAAKLAGVPVVLSHVHGLNRSKKSKRKLLNRFILKRVSRIFAVGEAVRQDILNSNPFLNPEKVFSLSNSIDIQRFSNIELSRENAKSTLGLKPESIVFGAVGRLAPTKGFSYLIKAFAKVQKNIPNAKLIFAGDGQLKEELQTLTEGLDISDMVLFLGRRTDMPSVFRAMDVFVLSSIAEGLPRSLLEAMASGVPVVGTNVGGIPEILVNRKYGQIIPPNDIDALAQAMIKTAQMPKARRQEMIDKARQRIFNEYSHDIVIKKLENIYDMAYNSVIK